MFKHLFISVFLAIRLKWENVRTPLDAGKIFLNLNTISNFNHKNQIRVTLNKSALPIEAVPWNKNFTRIDYIISSLDMRDSILPNGTKKTSEDINGTYSTGKIIPPYIAASIPFDYFWNRNISNTLGVSKRSEENSFIEIPDNFISFIIGNNECPENISDICQNQPLISDHHYLCAAMSLFYL